MENSIIIIKACKFYGFVSKCILRKDVQDEKIEKLIIESLSILHSTFKFFPGDVFAAAASEQRASKAAY